MQNSANRPKYSYNPTRRDGFGVIDNLGSLPNYIPGDQTVLRIEQKPYEVAAHEKWVGTVTYFDSVVTDADYVQPRDFWEKVLGKDPAQQERTVGNIVASLSKADKSVQAGTIGTYHSLSNTFCSPALTDRVNRYPSKNQQRPWRPSCEND